MQFYITTVNHNISTINYHIALRFCCCNISSNFYILANVSPTICYSFVLDKLVLIVPTFSWAFAKFERNNVVIIINAFFMF